MYNSSSLHILRQQALAQQQAQQRAAQQEMINRLSLIEFSKKMQSKGLLPLPTGRSDLLSTQAAYAELLRRNQAVEEWEKFKFVIDQYGVNGGMQLLQLLSKAAQNGPVQPKPKPKLSLQLFGSSLEQNPVQFSTQINSGAGPSEQYAKTMDSPVSEVSSGVGTMNSPAISDWDNLVSVSGLPSPDSSTSSSPPVANTPSSSPPLSTASGKKKDNLVINYQGRNLLDLHHNLTHQWAFQTAAPPKAEENSITYHRLYHPYGRTDDVRLANCPYCSYFPAF